MFNGQNVSVMPTQAYINQGESVELNASGASYYYWTPDYGLSNCFGPTTVASPATTTTYTVTGCELSSEELVVNGDFEQGNFAFTSSYQYTTNLVPEGTYYVGENANNYHYGFIGIGHGGTGNFMIVNGATNPGTNVWTEQISVSPNTYYAFSTWICNVSVGNPDVVAMLQFSINGIQLGEIFSGINELNVWEQFYVLWYSGNANIANISILNQNTIAGGNDFGLDDISFRRLESVGEAQSTINLQMPDIHLPDNINSVNCVFYPEGNEWDVRIGWSSAAVVSNMNIPLVGDLDDDGIPEIVCCSKNGDINISNYRYNNELLVFDGDIKQLKATISLQSEITASDGAAYGLIKLSNHKGLIVVACCDYKLRAYDISSINPSIPYWESDVTFGMDFGDWAVNIGFADFNADGCPEVYVRDKIYNAETGKLLAQANSSNSGSSYAHWSHSTHYKLSSPLAANVLGDNNLELILGNKIYTVEIHNQNGQTSNIISMAKSLMPPNGIVDDGHTQVADFNMDGFLDVFISVRDNMGSNGTIYGYVWDIHNDLVSEPFVINTSFSGKSIPMIGDIDNDGLLEVLIQSGVAGSNQKFQAYKYHPSTRTFSLMWGFTPDEDSYSNGITSFDFNQDGLLELIICDQSMLRIVNGSGISHITHNDTVPVYVMSMLPFSEITIMQYPVIADADDDGNAEIVSVGSNKLNIIESDGALWAPTRKVWNQYMYNVTNINNDLTITQYQFNNATPFTDPEGVVRRPFNNFLQQATTLDQYGRPYTAAADASLNGLEIENNDESILLKVTYSNDGDNTLFAPYSITAFANEYGGNILKTQTVTTHLQIDETATQYISLDKNDICGNNDLSSIVVAVNCSGIGIAQNGGHQPECDTINNLFSIDITALSDTTYLYESACEPFVWYGNELTQTGDYEHTLTNIYGCDSLLLLHLEMGSLDTLHVSANACEYYEWYGNTYLNSGIYNHIVHNEEGCDSIINLNLTINNSPNLEIHGLTQVAISSDLWPGIYNYCIADSIELQQCNVTWSCSNPEWIVLPSDNPYWFRLIANTLGKATLTTMADCESGCNAIASIEIQASFIGVDEIDDNQVSIYPNPASDRLIIKGEQMKQIIIYNCYGQRFNDTKMDLNDEVTIDTENMSNGLYIADIITTKGKITKRILIAK